ncbi:MAG: biotin/lipoyl-containing protein [Bacillota bacterium]
MRKFNVTVNGEVYNVEVEEQGQGEAISSSRPTTVEPVRTAPESGSAPKAEAPKAAAPKAKPTAVGGGEIVKSPLPGAVSDVKVSKGDKVTTKSVLLILEAMKMENEVYAPIDGTIEEVYVSKGDTVASGEPMVLIK